MEKNPDTLDESSAPLGKSSIIMKQRPFTLNENPAALEKSSTMLDLPFSLHEKKFRGVGEKFSDPEQTSSVREEKPRRYEEKFIQLEGKFSDSGVKSSRLGEVLSVAQAGESPGGSRSWVGL